MEHTPGPWRHTSLNGWDGVTSDQDGTICKLVFNNPENARLIAAAPALLEACKKALYESSLDRSETVLSHEVHEALNDAVFAAEGEG